MRYFILAPVFVKKVDVITVRCTNGGTAYRAEQLSQRWVVVHIPESPAGEKHRGEDRESGDFLVAVNDSAMIQDGKGGQPFETAIDEIRIVHPILQTKVKVPTGFCRQI
jgi:hypothetical protein